MKNLFYLIILTVIFVTGAMAQIIEEPTAETPSMTKLTLSGIESAEGTVDELNNRREGNTFVLNGAEEGFSYNLTMSMDYTAAQPDYDLGNRIVSGTWNVTVYKNDVYFGVMYGDISGGSILWDKTQPGTNTGALVGVTRYTEAQFTINGGLDGYSGQSQMVLEKALVGNSKLGEKDQTVMDATIELPISQR